MSRLLTLSFAVTGITLVLNIATGMILARALGPSDRGALAAAIIWPAFLLVLLYPGLGHSATVFSADQAYPLGNVVGTCMALTFLSTLLTIVVGFASIPVLLKDSSQQAVHSALILLLATPLTTFSYTGLSLIEGFGHIGLTQITRVVVTVVSTAGIGLLWWSNRLDVGNAVFVYVLANMVVFLLVIVLLGRLIPVKLQFSLDLAKQMLSFGLRGHAGDVTSALNLRMDQLVMSVLLSATSLGLYTVATTISSGPTAVSNAVGSITFPVIARIENPEDQQRALRHFSLIAFWLALASSLVLFPMVPFLISHFFGHSFIGGLAAARILVIASIPLGISVVLRRAFVGLRRPGTASIAETISLAITIVALLALLPIFGITGAAVASLMAYSGSCAYLLWQLHRSMQLSPRYLFVPTSQDIDRLVEEMRGNIARIKVMVRICNRNSQATMHK